MEGIRTCVIPVTSTVRRTSHLFLREMMHVQKYTFAKLGSRLQEYLLFIVQMWARVCMQIFPWRDKCIYISPFHTQCQGQFFIGTFLHRPKHVRVHLPERIHASDKQRAFIQNKQQEPWKKRLSRPQKLRLFRSTSISTSGLCFGFPWGGLCHSPLSWK